MIRLTLHPEWLRAARIRSAGKHVWLNPRFVVSVEVRSRWEGDGPVADGSYIVPSAGHPLSVVESVAEVLEKFALEMT